jgi:hypothetical protein
MVLVGSLVVDQRGVDANVGSLRNSLEIHAIIISGRPSRFFILSTFCLAFSSLVR